MVLAICSWSETILIKLAIISLYNNWFLVQMVMVFVSGFLISPYLTYLKQWGDRGLLYLRYLHCRSPHHVTAKRDQHHSRLAQWRTYSGTTANLPRAPDIVFCTLPIVRSRTPCSTKTATDVARRSLWQTYVKDLKSCWTPWRVCSLSTQSYDKRSEIYKKR